jgi:pimeloyl-ACP methyl ester carboxylesterase
MTKPGAVVFVHGIFGGAKTWSALLPRLKKNSYLDRFFDLELYNYPSPWAVFNPLKRIPDLGHVARGLITALRQDDRFKSRSCLVLVGHSQGGLIIQRMLVDTVRAGRADEDLARIRGVVLLATPNTGSELFLSARYAVEGLWRHPQEKSLRPFNEEIADIHAELLKRVVYAQHASSTSRPIRFDVYTGLEDGVAPHLRPFCHSVLSLLGLQRERLLGNRSRAGSAKQISKMRPLHRQSRAGRNHTLMPASRR